jgi:hypothetical protein
MPLIEDMNDTDCQEADPSITWKLHARYPITRLEEKKTELSRCTHTFFFFGSRSRDCLRYCPSRIREVSAAEQEGLGHDLPSR